jgi:MFS transporter, DHA1 family, tetracycline resistance protein
MAYRSRITEPLLRSRSGGLIAAMAFSTTATGALIICVPLELQQLHAGPAETGLTLAMFGFGMFSFEWFWGAVADRFGYRAPLAISQCLFALFIALLSQVESVPLIAATYFFACGMLVAGGPIPRSYVGTSVHPHLRATGLALLASQWAMAEAIGSGAAGVLIDHFPIRSVMLAAAALPVISALLVLLVFRGHVHAVPAQEGERRTQPAREGASVIRVLAITAALALLVQVGLGGELALLPVLVTGTLHLSASAAGAAMLVVGLIGGLLLVPGGRVADWWGRRPAMVLGGLVAAAGFLVYAIAGSLSVVLVGAVLRAAGASLIWPAATAWVAESMPRRRHGFYMGLFGEFENLGITVGPIAGGLVWSVAGIQSAFYGYAAACLASAAVAAITVGRAPSAARRAAAEARP